MFWIAFKAALGYLAASLIGLIIIIALIMLLAWIGGEFR